VGTIPPAEVGTTNKERNLNPLIIKLLELQRLDNEINEINLQIDATLSRLTPLKKEIKRIEDELVFLKKEIEEKELQRKRLEIEIGKREEDMKKYQSQLYNVKTQKEYDALEHEITNLKNLNSNDEDSVLAIYEILDSDKKKVSELKELKVKKDDELGRISNEINLQVSSKKDVISQKELERKTVRKSVPDNYLTIYDRIYSRFPGDVLTNIKNNMCMGCRITLPPRLQQEIYSEEKIIFCESCSRILSSAEE